MRRAWLLISMTVVIVFIFSFSFAINNTTAGSLIGCACIVLLLIIYLLWRSVSKPLDVVERGLEVLMSQDTASRLRRVGETHADRIVDIFNRLVSELKRERLKLFEQESFLNRLVRVSPMGIAVFDFKGRFTMVNRSFMEMVGLSRSPDSVVGLLPQDIESEILEAAMNLEPGDSITSHFGDTGIYRISRLWFMDSGFRRIFILIERLTEEVMKAERNAYGKVIRVISHEVNNTMGGVISLLELLGESVEDEDTRTMIESGENRCRALSGFIKSYADLVKLADPELILVDLNHELSEILPFLKALAGEDVILTQELTDEPLLVHIDPVMWQQVIVNIVKNSIESIHTRKQKENSYKGRISITAEKTDSGGISVVICDNGIGIGAETSQKIFTPFFSTKSNGLGIGLTLVGEILSRHGCKYSLRTGKDYMTRFRISFKGPIKD